MSKRDGSCGQHTADPDETRAVRRKANLRAMRAVRPQREGESELQTAKNDPALGCGSKHGRPLGTRELPGNLQSAGAQTEGNRRLSPLVNGSTTDCRRRLSRRRRRTVVPPAGASTRRSATGPDGQPGCLVAAGPPLQTHLGGTTSGWPAAAAPLFCNEILLCRRIATLPDRFRAATRRRRQRLQRHQHRRQPDQDV